MKKTRKRGLIFLSPRENESMASLENFRLTVFRAVAEHLSFRKAAEELHLTQPAVSLQIKALEEDLDVQLFDRTGRRPRLTAAGVLLAKYAQKSGEILELAGYEVSSLGGNGAGRLSLGASTTIAQYVLPALLGGFLKVHPRVRPTLVSGNTEHIVEALEQGTIALGFIEGPPRSANVRTEAFLRDELVLIAPVTHAWSRRRALTPAEVAAGPLLMRERGSGTRRIIELALEHVGVGINKLNVVMELDSTEAIKSAVAAGYGAGFVSRSAIAADLRLGRGFRVVNLAGLRLTRDFLLVLPRGPEPRGLAHDFRLFLLEKTRTHATDR